MDDAGLGATPASRDGQLVGSRLESGQAPESSSGAVRDDGALTPGQTRRQHVLTPRRWSAGEPEDIVREPLPSARSQPMLDDALCCAESRDLSSGEDAVLSDGETSRSLVEPNLCRLRIGYTPHSAHVLLGPPDGSGGTRPVRGDDVELLDPRRPTAARRPSIHSRLDGPIPARHPDTPEP